MTSSMQNPNILAKPGDESDLEPPKSGVAEQTTPDSHAATKLDPFDPASLRLGASATAGIGVKRVLNNIPCSKPNKQEFVRVHPDESYRLETAILRDEVQREDYLVASALWRNLAAEIKPVRLAAAITRHGNVFLWPAILPAPDGRSNRWHESMLEAQSHATRYWVRVQADMSIGEYSLFEATGNFPEPEWPDLTFKQMLKLAFRTRMIDSMDHAILRSLRGEA